MTDTATEPAPPAQAPPMAAGSLPPLQRHQHLEADTFCVGCGYNLHGQPVTRDDRLGIFVCRCPECGRYHPAGIGVTAASAWTSRLATALLIFWVLFVLHAVAWIGAGFIAIAVMHVETFTFSKTVAPDGREVVWAELPAPAATAGAGIPAVPGGWTAVYKGTTQPAVSYGNVRVVNRYTGVAARQGLLALLMYVLAAAGIGLGTGVLLVTFLWHWRRRHYAWPMVLLPTLAAVLFLLLIHLNDWGGQWSHIYGWVVSRAAGYAALEAAFIGVGIVIGRPIARGLLRMFIPPRPRQHFAFLWRADGLTMPPATPATR